LHYSSDAPTPLPTLVPHAPTPVPAPPRTIPAATPIYCPQVHCANPQDHFVHKFTHRVARGVLIAIGRPDGRLYCQTQTESWILCEWQADTWAGSTLRAGCGQAAVWLVAGAGSVKVLGLKLCKVPLVLKMCPHVGSRTPEVAMGWGGCHCCHCCHWHHLPPALPPVLFHQNPCLRRSTPTVLPYPPTFPLSACRLQWACCRPRSLPA